MPAPALRCGARIEALAAGQPAVAHRHVVEALERPIDFPQQVAIGLAVGILGGQIKRVDQPRHRR